jgi:hypothetical protein
MVEFMVLAAPRSGTTWASNWLTTDKTLCLHDPLWTHHYSDLDNIRTKKTLGVACTGLYMFPDFVNKHSARKIILHRDENEINKSLKAIGLPELSNTERDLNKIEGIHIDWRSIFDDPKKIYEYLTGLEFDKERHDFLKEIEMQPNFEGLKVGREVTRRLVNELQEIARNV